MRTISFGIVKCVLTVRIGWVCLTDCYSQYNLLINAILTSRGLGTFRLSVDIRLHVVRDILAGRKNQGGKLEGSALSWHDNALQLPVLSFCLS